MNDKTEPGYAFPNHPVMPTKTASFGDCGNQAQSSGFITKDSGERQQFASGMKRDTTVGKWLFHLVRFGPMFMRWVGLLTRGAVKYDENNWMQANGPAELKRFIESAERHFAVWVTYRQTGINIEDPENPTRLPLTEDHAAAVFFNINGAEYVVGRLELVETVPVGGTTPYRGEDALQVTSDEEVDRIIAREARVAQQRAQQDKQKADAAMDAEIRRFHAADAPYAHRLGRLSPGRIELGNVSTTELRHATGVNPEGDECSWRLVAERERY